MITTHPFDTSREAIQWMWSGPAHARRQAPDASLTELFIHLHGMLLTKIQLDDFKPMLARFEEKLHIEGASSSYPAVPLDRRWAGHCFVEIRLLTHLIVAL